MAPVPLEHEPRYVPLAVTTAHLGLIVYLTYAVGASLYTSYKSLSPSQDTRKRLSMRKRLAPAFITLAALAFSLAAYSNFSYAALSYKAWSAQRVDPPERFIGEKGLLPDTNSNQVYLTAKWLDDTPIYYDALEIIAEKARRFWWGQQIDLATVSWSMLLAIEGRRRRIPLLSAFMTLAHLVNLSFAQNLFYLAILLTPSPIPLGDDELELPVVPLPTSRWARIRDAILPPKPTNWCPHPSLYFGSLGLNFIAIFMLPFAADTPSFVKIVVLARVSTFLPLLMPKVVPVSWGVVHPHPHNAYGSFTTLFRFLSAAIIALHAKASFYGLSYNTPDSHYHRHSKFIPWNVEERSRWERSTTTLGKVLGSTGDHPVVAAVGWDVLICTLSIGLWTAVRATDVEGIIASINPFYKSSTSHPQTSIEEKPKPEAIAESEATDAHMTLRRRGRPGKSRITSIASVASSSGASEDVGAPSPRKRGRTKKKQPEEEKAYMPTAEVSRNVREGDVLPSDENLDWESAALTWGIAALGGLGCACAGVFGAECTSRRKEDTSFTRERTL